MTLTGGVLAAVAALGCSPRPRPRDVVVISVDTLRADSIGAAGHPTVRTPNIDALIRKGTHFTHAITPLPRTTPALASLFTGLWPKHHGSREVGDPLLEGTLLSEVLKKRGYRTL